MPSGDSGLISVSVHVPVVEADDVGLESVWVVLQLNVKVLTLTRRTATLTHVGEVRTAYYSCGLSFLTIEYSSPSVCLAVCEYVCVLLWDLHCGHKFL